MEENERRGREGEIEGRVLLVRGWQWTVRTREEFIWVKGERLKNNVKRRGGGRRAGRTAVGKRRDSPVSDRVCLMSSLKKLRGAETEREKRRMEGEVVLRRKEESEA